MCAKRKPLPPKPPEPTRIEFETFAKPADWIIDKLRADEPCTVNASLFGLHVKRYRVLIELIPESDDVLFERIQQVHEAPKSNMHTREACRTAAAQLGRTLKR